MCGNDKKTRFLNSIWCFLSVAILFWVGNAPAEIVDRIVVIVNDDIILASDLDQALKPAEVSLKNRGYSSIDRQRIIDGQRQQVLDRLIYDKLTDQQVQRHNLKVNDSEVDATIQRIRNANKITEEELRRALELDGITFDAYRKEIQEKILRTRLVNREVKSKIVVTDEDVKSFYNAHKDQYAGSTKYDLRHILLKVSPEANQAEKERIKDQINLLRERLEAGEPFDKLAGIFSEAPTASRGGRLGVFGTHLLTEEIKQALKGLNAKQYSQVVETDQGYQIFYVESIISTGGKTLEQATPEIYEKLFAEVVDQKFKTWIEDLRKRSHIQILD
jgi:peptidyl-prolyl cis-trans isomerase SurA